MKYYKGMDLSTLIEVESCGGKFYDGAEAEDAVVILKRYGMNAVRIRLFNDPYSEKGEPYGAGTNDLETALALAKRARKAGLDILLDYHYSDFGQIQANSLSPKHGRDIL